LRAGLHWCRRKTEAGLKVRSRADTRMGGRTSGPGHFGLVLSVLVLCLQLVAPGLHSSPQLDSRSGNGDLSGLFGEHALCIGAAPGSSTGEPASPAPPAKDHHHDFASSCCLWHSNPSPPVPSVAAGSVVSFESTGIDFPAPNYTVVVRARPASDSAARAPPASA
jgi:hypothetical protein